MSARDKRSVGVGTTVEFDLSPAVRIHGVVLTIGEGWATVVEGHAYHREWGGSGGARGEEHFVQVGRLRRIAPSRLPIRVREKIGVAGLEETA